ncbi:CDP-alcohol phosphatidyltransferase family protein [Sulfurovum sp. zt1-1]|uniref:CDP-alcohol phosphatidyltransferase family protein n=2 Tax=Sulfurovum zhangzhouensis TaxID=3019067 RepID=A0ABT7QXU0_9BACT|nr:CDP-alcohol phosphatidyltransferase family protein [Sulfurovum zhangzhouensis]
MQWNIPNLLSLFRIIAAPFLLLSGWLGMPILFYIILGFMLLSDALDGFIARILNQTSALGARLDTYGDILTYISTLGAVWWLWPDLIQNELYYIISAAVLYTIPALISFMKFGELASYHTWITKISAVMMALGVVLLLLLKEPLLFHWAVYFLVLETLENITITLLIKEQQSNIHSIWHALKTKD